METALAPLEYRESPEWGETEIYRDGNKVGVIKAGMSSLGEKQFWQVATGVKPCKGEATAFWLYDNNRMISGSVNFTPLATLNQAKALAEYHFSKPAA